MTAATTAGTCKIVDNGEGYFTRLVYSVPLGDLSGPDGTATVRELTEAAAAAIYRKLQQARAQQELRQSDKLTADDLAVGCPVDVAGLMDDTEEAE